MDRADPRTCQHRNRDLGDHRQINRDPIAFLDAVLLQHIGKTAHCLVQLAICDAAILGRIVALPQDRDLLGAARQMAVDAIVAGVQCPIFIPGDANVAVKRGVFYAAIGFDPVEPVAVLAPKPVRIVQRMLVKPQVIGFADLARLRGWAESGIIVRLDMALFPPRRAAPRAAPRTLSPKTILPSRTVTIPLP